MVSVQTYSHLESSQIQLDHLSPSKELPVSSLNNTSSSINESAQKQPPPPLSEIDCFEQELLQKYSPQVVKALFNNVRKLNIRSLTAGDRKRFEIWCHYFEIESKFRKKIYGTQSPTKRLLNHFLKYAQPDVYYRLHYKYSGLSLSHEHIDTFEKNVQTLLKYLPELISTFGESLCHRSLASSSIISNEVIVGFETLLDIEDIKNLIRFTFKNELFVRDSIDNHSKDKLELEVEILKEKLSLIKNHQIAQELYTKLALKLEKYKWLKSPFPKSVIQKQAELFQVSRWGESWAEKQDKLVPIPGSGANSSEEQKTRNVVYFLKSPEIENQNVAVFKHATVAAAKEALVYDAALIFGLHNALVPTKLKKIKDKFGSIQVFQKGLSWTDFFKSTESSPKSVAKSEPLPYTIEQNSSLKAQSAPGLIEPSLRAEGKEKPLDLQMDVINKISMEDFLKAALATLIFGNRDLHAGNFFFMPKEEGGYSIVIFDNEDCFHNTNYLLTDKNGDHHLPIRNAFLSFPQADVIFKGELKENLVKFVNSFKGRFDKFVNYLQSPSGQSVLNKIPKKDFNNLHLNAFKDRIDCVINCLKSEKECSYRDLVNTTFPLYPAFLELTKLLYSNFAEMMVGYHSAEDLCEKAVKKGLMNTDKKAAFLKKLKQYENK
ncbi:MAG: hypothetical protein S4CHLAM7_06940 [Chlamydiae bacterium]|nr:hypothetical protein [Chlamydiota bacterium]